MRGIPLLASLGVALLTATPLLAQKRVSKTLLQPHISSIVIDGQQCFDIRVEAVPSDQVVVRAEMEGEYQGDVLVQTETLGNTLHISTVPSPAFQWPNDKLGAHKVLSIRLHVSLPEFQQVRINGAFASLSTQGRFREVDIHLQDGQCELRHQSETTRVTTDAADIYAWVSEGVVETSSRHGRVEVDSLPPGDSRLSLRTRHGDITVRRPS